MTRLATAVSSLVMPAIVGLIVFAAAGRFDFPFVWAVLGILVATCLAIAFSVDRGLVRERVRPGAGNQDRISRPLGIVLLLAHWILAGLDIGRFHWSSMPLFVQLAGVACYTVSMAALVWAMKTNPFYSSVVRIQSDRGHRAIVVGPYRFVRHPGYAATLAAMVGGGIALGSWYAMIPVAANFAVFIRRTLLEDRMLQSELPGYAEYAQTVRSRIVPGIW